MCKETDNLYHIHDGSSIKNSCTQKYFEEFEKNLDVISNQVQNRASSDKIFQWTILDPKNMPKFVYI